MFKIIFLSVMILFICCAQNYQQEVEEITPVEYSLISHADFDSLPAQNVTILINGQDFSGQGPINRYFGKISDNRITPPIGSTMMAGPEHLMQYEQQFLAALDSALLAGIGTDTLRMLKSGVVQMVFVKIEEKQ